MINKKGNYFKSNRLLFLSLIIINLIILLLSLWYYRVEKNAFINQKIDQLKSIADTKIDQFVDWRNERLSDARYLSINPQIIESFCKVKSDTSNPAFRTLLYNHLNGMFLNGKYESMIAFDQKGESFFSLPLNRHKGSGFFSQVSFTSLGSRSILMSDLYSDNDTAFMQIVVPQRSSKDYDTLPDGWILMNINLSNTILPLLETIPIPSQTMEVLIVNENVSDVFRVNPEEFKSDSRTGSLKDRPTGHLRFDSDTIRNYPDGDGNMVIAVCYPVPGSESILMVKVDKKEAFADVRKLMVNLVSMVGLIMLAFSSSASFFWMKQRNEFMNMEIEKKMMIERLDMLSKFANDAIIVYTNDLTILQVNDKALELYGYKRDEILGMSADLLRSPELRPQLIQMLEITMRDGGYRYDTIHIRQDGIRFPVEVSLRYMELMGSPCFQAVVRDITQRKQFEKALIASEERLRLITNTMPQIVWTARPDGSFDFVNSRFEFLTGFYPLREKTSDDFIHPDDRERVISYWSQAIHDVREHQLRFRVRMKDDSFRWFLCLAIPMCNEKGEVIRWYGSATDIDELENIVARRTNELSDLYNNAPCGYHSLDVDGVFIKINNTALKWLGYEREEITGKLSFTDLITENSKEAFKKNFKVLKKKGFVDNLEYEMVRKDGTVLPVLLSATAIYDDNGNFIMTRSTTIDHTVRKRHEEEILKLNSILQDHSQNLEYANKELEAFTFSVSHDLRAPLRAINGFSQILLDEYGESFDEEGRKILDTVLNNAGRMRNLIDDLLRLSRTGRQELSYATIDMHALFNSLVEESRQQHPGRTITANVHPMPKAYGDLALLKQVISNLLSNAIKFSSKKKTSEIEIGATEEPNEIVFFVKDNGTGFDMKFAPELFGVFRRLNNADKYEGTGVGLALVKRIIDKHGGRVWANSEPGNGATFYFSVPRIN